MIPTLDVRKLRGQESLFTILIWVAAQFHCSLQNILAPALFHSTPIIANQVLDLNTPSLVCSYVFYSVYSPVLIPLKTPLKALPRVTATVTILSYRLIPLWSIREGACHTINQGQAVCHLETLAITLSVIISGTNKSHICVFKLFLAPAISEISRNVWRVVQSLSSSSSNHSHHLKRFWNPIFSDQMFPDCSEKSQEFSFHLILPSMSFPCQA